MARMYPSPINSETKSDAERVLYDAFRDQLDDSYTVFHGVAWQSQDKRGRARDGEADFVIVHPQRGILVAEAKGGRIGYDPSTGQWTSIDPSGQVFNISNPFGQALDSKYILRAQLVVMLGVSRRQISIGHAAAFPDVVVGQELLGPDKPREIVLDATDLADLSTWVDQALGYWRGQEAKGASVPCDQMVPALVELLGKAWELRPALWGDLVLEHGQLIRLTEQQYQILDVLNRQRRALISGCAGSGKTMLAAEKAARLARQGFHVLLTCFNKNLAVDLRAQLKPSSNLEIIHFHGLCHDLAEKAGVLPENPQYDDDFFQNQLPKALMEAAAILDVFYDAIVVDEGQDFEEAWWVPLQALFRDRSSGILYIFFDDNQRLYVQRGAFPIPQEPYPLTVNCRNTQSIHGVVVQFYDADVRPIARGPVGRPPELAFYDKHEGLQSTLMAMLRRLTEDEQIPAEEIAVLSPLLQKSQLWADASASIASKTSPDSVPFHPSEGLTITTPLLSS